MTIPPRLRPRTMLPLTALALFTTLLTQTGCGFLFREETVDPLYDVSGATVLIVPFEHDDRWYYESGVGDRLAKALNTMFYRGDCGSITTIDDAEVHNEVMLQLDDPVEWTAIGEAAEADYILFGRIDDYRSENSRTIGILQGEIVIRYTVWDVEADAVGREAALNVRYPESNDDYDQRGTSLDFEEDSRRIEGRLLTLTARNVIDDLCGYRWDKVMEPNRRRNR